MAYFFARELNPTGVGEYLSLSLYIYIYTWVVQNVPNLTEKKEPELDIFVVATHYPYYHFKFQS